MKKKDTVKIKVIAGSTRPNRFNIQPAVWIYDLAKQRTDIDVELVDLEKVNLPILDEPMPASMHQYSKEHTKNWAKIIADADGFIFVTPEYNHSMSGALKNAIDFLYAEWNHKPVSFISYGSAAGGARAVEHLRGIAGELKMYDMREQLLFPHYYSDMDEIRDIQATKKVHIPIISVTWGFNSEEGLLSHQPDFLIRKPEELVTVLKKNEIAHGYRI